jgi:hypothetical protein
MTDLPRPVEEVQRELDQAVLDLQQEAGDIALFDALGRLTEAYARVGVNYTDEQVDAIDRALTIRGFKTINEYLADPDYISASITAPESIAALGIVGNVLQDLRDKRPTHQGGTVVIFRHRDTLIAQQN